MKKYSKCCLAEVKSEVCSDFIGDNPKTMKIGTCYYTCQKCGQPCDVKEGFISVKEMRKGLKSKRTLLWYLESWWYRYFWNYLDMLPRRIYWFFQRGFRGFGDNNTWDFDNYLSTMIPQALRQLKKYSIGLPTWKKGKSEHQAKKEWNEIQNKIIKSFELAKKYIDLDITPVEWKEKYEKQYNEGMKLFAKWFFAFWD